MATPVLLIQLAHVISFMRYFWKFGAREDGRVEKWFFDHSWKPKPNSHELYEILMVSMEFKTCTHRRTVSMGPKEENTLTHTNTKWHRLIAFTQQNHSCILLESGKSCFVDFPLSLCRALSISGLFFSWYDWTWCAHQICNGIYYQHRH